MADPWQLLSSSQKKAMGLVSEAFDGVVRLGRDAVTQPDEALHRLTALVAAVGDLAASSTKPMESLLASQRNLANAMTSFAQLQKEMAEVVERLAAHHTAVVDALEKLAGPALTVSDLIRSEPVVEKAQERAKGTRGPRKT